MEDTRIKAATEISLKQFEPTIPETIKDCVSALSSLVLKQELLYFAFLKILNEFDWVSIFEHKTWVQVSNSVCVS